MKILGISAYYHDSAACLVDDGEIIAAAQEERFTRRKYDASFPSNAVKYCLAAGGVEVSGLDAVVFYDKPWLKFERLLETYYVYAPKGARSFMASMPVWVKDKLFLKNLLLDELSGLGSANAFPANLLFSEHHLSHAASAFYPSPFREAAILTIDGVGEWATATISRGSDRTITLLRELKFPHSPGLLYSAFTHYLGFKVNSGEYKLMGLSPFGNEGFTGFRRYYKLITDNIVDLKSDGSIFLNQAYFDYAAGLKMTDDSRWEKLLGFSRRLPDAEITQDHCDLALAAQKITEEIVLGMAKTAKELTGSGNLAIAGGVGLNCVANSRILNSGLFKNIWIQPAAGDAGGAVGAALGAFHIFYDRERRFATQGNDNMKGSYLGPEFSDTEIELAANKLGAVYKRYEGLPGLCKDTAAAIAEGAVVGWFQGRMEWGPRALGNRSILGDARNPEMQKRMNLRIKRRESFRPFAPSVPVEFEYDYFDTASPSPYMLFTAGLKNSLRKPLPANFNDFGAMDKLYFDRSVLPAITHVDFSARLQTVDKLTNPAYWQLLSAFRELTGCAVLVNTSFNVRGEPIVCTPEDAYRCFMNTDIDYLAAGSFLFSKKEQPAWQEAPNLVDGYVPD